MIYPPELEPVETEKILLPSGLTVSIPKAAPTFQRWRGKPMANTFGGKPCLEWAGCATFAEVAILRLFENGGWSEIDSENPRSRKLFRSVFRGLERQFELGLELEGLGRRANPRKGRENWPARQDSNLRPTA